MSTQAEQAGAEHTGDVAELTYRDAVNAALLDEMNAFDAHAAVGCAGQRSGG